MFISVQHIGSCIKKNGYEYISILVLFFEIPSKYQEYILDFEISPRIIYKIGFLSKIKIGFVY
jgi:hypothetical protein